MRAYKHMLISPSGPLLEPVLNPQLLLPIEVQAIQMSIAKPQSTTSNMNYILQGLSPSNTISTNDVRVKINATKPIATTTPNATANNSISLNGILSLLPQGQTQLELWVHEHERHEGIAYGLMSTYPH